VSDGVLLRVLPGGGHEFVLQDPELARIVLDGRLTLCFGRTSVTVAGPFTFELDGIEHWLDPRFTESLSPLLWSFPGSARWLWASPADELTLVLMQGQRLVVPGLPVPSGWSVGATTSVEVRTR